MVLGLSGQVNPWELGWEMGLQMPGWLPASILPKGSCHPFPWTRGFLPAPNAGARTAPGRLHWHEKRVLQESLPQEHPLLLGTGVN